MVLDRNPANFFAEVEQASFNPSNLVPGDRPVAGPDADGAHLQLPRHPSAPHRPQLRAAADQPPAVPGALLQQGRADGLPPRGQPAGLRAELLRRPRGRSGEGDRDRLGRRRGRAGAHGLREALRRRRLLPAGHARARRHGRRGARGARRQHRRPRLRRGDGRDAAARDRLLVARRRADRRARRRRAGALQRIRRRARSCAPRRSWSTPAPARPERQRPRRSARTRRPPPRRGRRSTRRP